MPKKYKDKINLEMTKDKKLKLIIFADDAEDLQEQISNAKMYYVIAKTIMVMAKKLK